MKTIWGFMLVALAAGMLWLPACGDDDGNTDGGSDSDTDTDTDSDTDTDTDSDTDADTDTDTDADTDTDTDTDGDTDTASDGDACVVSVDLASVYAVDLDGVCQPSTDTCEGGTAADLGVDEAGNCVGDGIVCCINTDVCEGLTLPMGTLACSATEVGSYCMNVGCPDSGFCCISL